jgi:predicted secreted protein
MGSENNVLKGKELVLLVRNDADTAWEILGGVKSRSVVINNPTEEVTSSSTISEFVEREYTGYSDISFSVDGTADTRVGIVEPSTGLVIAPFKRLLQIGSTATNRCGRFQLLSTNPDLGFIVEGEFNVTSVNVTGATPGLLTFSATLESRAEISITF